MRGAGDPSPGEVYRTSKLLLDEFVVQLAAGGVDVGAAFESNRYCLAAALGNFFEFVLCFTRRPFVENFARIVCCRIERD